MKNLLILLALITSIFLFSCEEDTADKLDGSWYLQSDGVLDNMTMSISTDDNSLTFGGTTYEGSYSGNSFSGNWSGTNQGFKISNYLKITLTSDTEISGYIRTTVSYSGDSETDSESFTGKKK